VLHPMKIPPTHLFLQSGKVNCVTMNLVITEILHLVDFLNCISETECLVAVFLFSSSNIQGQLNNTTGMYQD